MKMIVINFTLYAILFANVFAAGCSNQPIETTDYLLRHAQAANSSGVAEAPTIALRRVEVAAYLDQRGLVLETSAYEISIARHNNWAEPLSDAVRRYLQVAIAEASGQAVAAQLTHQPSLVQEIDVIVHQLHGSANGDVRLVAEWRVSDTGDGATLTQRNFSATTRQDTDGYAALVRAHQVLLDKLASDIASSL